MPASEPYSPKFGQPFVIGPLGPDEERVMTRFTILPDSLHATEFAGWVRWRVVGDDFVLNDNVVMPPLERPIVDPGKDAGIPIEVETDAFTMRFKIRMAPGAAAIPAAYIFTIPPGLHAPHRGRGLRALADPIEPDWDFVRRCLEIRGIKQDEQGYWIVDGKEVGTRDAARVVLGIG